MSGYTVSFYINLVLVIGAGLSKIVETCRKWSKIPDALLSSFIVSFCINLILVLGVGLSKL